MPTVKLNDIFISLQLSDVHIFIKINKTLDTGVVETSSEMK